MEFPVSSFRPLFQLGDFFKGLVCAVLFVMLIMVQNSLTGNFCFMAVLHRSFPVRPRFCRDAGGKGITDLTDGLVRLKL